MSVILANTLSVSYFTYQDEYWTIYYVKPYSRLPVFLIGVLAACTYYSYTREHPETMRLATYLSKMKESNLMTVLWLVVGWTLIILMVILMQVINNSPNNVPEFWNMLYLMVSRPLFIMGFSLVIMPVILGTKVCTPATAFLSHDFWTPFSRLTYGAFLSHGVFMVFKGYNTERGQWGCAFDAFLFFLAYITFSYIFSLATGLIIEMPCA
jgi:hypothetical protein